MNHNRFPWRLTFRLDRANMDSFLKAFPVTPVPRVAGTRRLRSPCPNKGVCHDPEEAK